MENAFNDRPVETDGGLGGTGAPQIFVKFYFFELKEIVLKWKIV